MGEIFNRGLEVILENGNGLCYTYHVIWLHSCNREKNR